MKKTFLLLILAAVIFVVFVGCAKEKTINPVGGNVSENGQDIEYYVTDNGKKVSFHKKQKSTSNESVFFEIAGTGDVELLIVENGWVYYFNEAPPYEGIQLFRVRTDGTGYDNLIFWNSDDWRRMDFENIYIADEYMYFEDDHVEDARAGDDDVAYIYRMRLDGTGFEIFERFNTK
jgi:hypothetical protein